MGHAQNLTTTTIYHLPTYLWLFIGDLNVPLLLPFAICSAYESNPIITLLLIQTDTA